ncbi:MAG: hypothetical protein M3R17_16195 [Bacteroidota bacterium]|nr:hypothetical protein [Bacteroidota bacterium]
MKKITAITALLFLCLVANAQDWSGKVYKIGTIYPGYYVSLKGDTVRGYFMHNNQVKNQLKCEYYKNETDRNTTQSFGPEDISSYVVADKLYRSIHFSGGLLAKPMRFNLVTTDGGGGISIFNFYDETYAREPDGSIKYTVVYYKPNDAANPKPMMLQDFGLGFAKKMAAFVADYEELSKKVADKEKGYGMIQIDKIVEEYNTWYKTK